MEICRKSGALCLLDKPEWPTSLIKGFELLKCTYLLFKNSETNIVFRISFHQYVCCLHLLHVRRNKGEKNNGTCWPGFCFVFPKKNTKREHLSHPPPSHPHPHPKKTSDNYGRVCDVGGWRDIVGGRGLKRQSRLNAGNKVYYSPIKPQMIFNKREQAEAVQTYTIIDAFPVTSFCYVSWALIAVTKWCMKSIHGH